MRPLLPRPLPFVPLRSSRLLALVVASASVAIVGCQSDDMSRSISIEDVEMVRPESSPPSLRDDPPTDDGESDTSDRGATMGSSDAPLPSPNPRRQVIKAEPTVTPTATATAVPSPTPTPRPIEALLEGEVVEAPRSSSSADVASAFSTDDEERVRSNRDADDDSNDDASGDDREDGDGSELEGFVSGTAAGGSSREGDARTVAVWTPSGHLLPATAAADDGWIVTTPCGNEAELDAVTIAESPQVLLDAGHGGDETGSVTPDGIAEKSLNLKVARRVRQRLQDEGISVVMLRDDDTRITVPVRSAIANALKPELFVSIHHNGGATSESDSPPVEVFHQHDSREAKRLAGLLYESVQAELAPFSYRWPANSFEGAQPRYNGEGDDLYGVLRRSEVPTVLSEAFYIDGATGDTIAKNAQVLEAEAQGIVTSILRYLDTDDFGSGFRKGQQMTLLAPNSGGAAGCVDPELQ